MTQPPYPPSDEQPWNYPPPPPQPYSGSPDAYPAVNQPKNGMGVSALICGLLSLPAALTVVGGVLLGVAAIVCGAVGRGRAKRGEANNGGMATAGIVTGALGVVASVVVVIVMITAGMWLFNEGGGKDFVDCLNRAGDDVAAQQACQEQWANDLEDRFTVTVTPAP